MVTVTQQQQQQKPPLSSSPNPLKKPLVKLLLVTIFCSIFCSLGSYSNSSKFTLPHQNDHNSPDCLHLNFTTHNHFSAPLNLEPLRKLPLPQKPTTNLSFCHANFTNYLPCHYPYQERRISVVRFLPRSDENVRSLIPRPNGYKKPFPWSQSRDVAWFNNVPFKRLAEYKKSQNWVRLEGDKIFFPGGGTSFVKGVKGYIQEIGKVLPLKSGKINIAR